MSKIAARGLTTRDDADSAATYIGRIWKLQSERGCVPAKTCEGDCGCHLKGDCSHFKCMKNCVGYRMWVDGAVSPPVCAWQGGACVQAPTKAPTTSLPSKFPTPQPSQSPTQPTTTHKPTARPTERPTINCAAYNHKPQYCNHAGGCQYNAVTQLCKSKV